MAPKKNAQKMSLGDFLGDQSLGSWADEMEDMPVASGPQSRSGYGMERRAVSMATGSGDRGFDHERTWTPREQLPLPTKPPYTAHLGNLPFDATQVDIEKFFDGCQVTNVRIVEDKVERRPKGFGYVEFATLDGLKQALELNMTQFQGRNLKISVADPPNRPEREQLDWTRKGPLPDLGARRVSERAGGFRNYEGPPEMERGGSRRGASSFEGDGKVRDFNNWERKGPLSPAAATAPPMRDGGRVRVHDGPPRERKNSPAWGEGRSGSQDGPRKGPGEPKDRPTFERQPTAADLDPQWRARMRPDPPAKSSSPTPEPSAPSSPAQPPAPAVRPKLNLAKRTVSEVEKVAPAAPETQASIFGGAKPIDTAAREREVAQRRELLNRQKREADEKAREERKQKEVTAKAAAAHRDSSPEKTAAIENGKPAGAAKENDAETPTTKPKYEVLASLDQDATGTDAGADNGAKDPAPSKDSKEKEGGPQANGTSNKPTKRNDRDFSRGERGDRDRDREPPRAPRSSQQGSWRRKPSGPGAGSGSAPQAPANAQGEHPQQDDDGWSTVPAKGKGGRGRGSGPQQQRDGRNMAS